MAMKEILTCENQECKAYMEKAQIGKRHLVYRDGRFVDAEPLYCPVCKAPLVITMMDDNEGDISVNAALFGSLSDKQKHDVLKKRSDDHFKKVGKDEKQWRQEKVVKQYLGDK